MTTEAMSPSQTSASPPIADAERRFYELWAEVRDLGSVAELVSWDQETKMPDGAAAQRAKMQATLAGVLHQKATSERLWEALLACEELAASPERADDQVFAAQVRIARRDVERSRCLPESLAKALAEAASHGTVAWQRARKESDFAFFEPHLTELLRLAREKAAALAPMVERASQKTGAAGGSEPGPTLYDALLDTYEPGAREADLAPLFDDLVGALAPLVQEVVDSGRTVDEGGVRGRFDAEKQRLLGRHAVAAFGFDFERGRIDLSTHPFCVGVTPSDVRMTWRFMDDDVRSGLYGILHESGHGLYEQGITDELWRTPLGDAVSLGIHESQSRLWENQVGRNLGFWRWLWPTFAELFPEHAATTSVEEIWPALHTVKPSLIRVEADEVTYNLHVAVRFRLERALLAGDLEVPDLPAAWDDAYEDLLGVRADRPAEGVLQDIHWSQAMFGYFPTYTLGTLAGAQLFAAAGRDLGDLDEAFAAGDFAPLLGWLRRTIHAHGRRYSAAELIERATGSPLAADDLLADLQSTARRAYGL